MNARDEAEQALVLADEHLIAGSRQLAASALDRAYGLLPHDEAIAQQRRGLLDDLSLEEHGLVWRYVPAGAFRMGSADGDPDERPVHSRTLDAFWITDIPLTWTAYCRLMRWPLPPAGRPRDDDPLLESAGRDPGFMLLQIGKIRRQYCGTKENDTVVSWDKNPMIATSVGEAEDLAARLNTTGVRYGLPTEAEWEKAARGGLVDARWSWGNTPPTHAVCDFDRFGSFQLADPRNFPANGYGLHGMCGGVSEWTADRYDALAYQHASRHTAPGPFDLNAPYVIRGGSWADCAAAVTVSFRAAQTQSAWNKPRARGSSFGIPTVGFRLVRRYSF